MTTLPVLKDVPVNIHILSSLQGGNLRDLSWETPQDFGKKAKPK